MTSMDVCCNDLWFMPGAELFKWCPRLKQLCRHLALLLNWSAITEVSWGNASPSLFCSASTLAAVQMPTDNNWHRWWAETQKDRQRKRTTHRSKKTGRLYTHCPREDIAWQYYQLIYFKLFFLFFFYLLFFSIFSNCSFFFSSTCHMRI